MGTKVDWLWMLFVLAGSVVVTTIWTDQHGVGFMLGCLIWRSARRPV